jgi:cellulose biosynthesis protein BcsQ
VDIIGCLGLYNFNNKGGVGKTTLTGNVAAHFATKLHKQALLIYCDPQCNSTQLLLSDDEIERNASVFIMDSRILTDIASKC